MIWYSWTAFSGNAMESLAAETLLGERSPGCPVAMGISDDRARAMQAGEEVLACGTAAVVIIEAVRPGMAAHTLAPCYARTGVSWVSRRAPGGRVCWERFFTRADPDCGRLPGRIGP